MKWTISQITGGGGKATTTKNRNMCLVPTNTEGDGEREFLIIICNSNLRTLIGYFLGILLKEQFSMYEICKW